MLSKDVINLGKQYGLKVEVLGDIITIDSMDDHWVAYIKNNRVYLKHQNNKHGKCKHHPQRSFSNFYQCFDSIQQHDRSYIGAYNKMFRIKELLEQIN